MWPLAGHIVSSEDEDAADRSDVAQDGIAGLANVPRHRLLDAEESLRRQLRAQVSSDPSW